jgi:hypothetical protein
MIGRFLGGGSGEEDPPRTAVMMDLVELARHQPRICDNGPGVAPAAGEHQGSSGHTVLAGDQHPISGPGAEFNQFRRQGIHRSPQVPGSKRHQFTVKPVG